MAAVADVGRREVKIYLFHYPAFFGRTRQTLWGGLASVHPPHRVCRLRQQFVICLDKKLLR